MAETLNTKKLRIIPEDELVLKSENTAFLKRTLEALLQRERKLDAKVDALGDAFRQLMDDLKNQVDGLFVSDRVKKLEEAHKERMGGLNDKLTSIDEKMASVDKKMSKVKNGYTPIKGKDYFDGASAQAPSMEMVNEALKKPMEDFQKSWEKKVQALIESRRMIGGSPHNLVQIFNASSQVDGFKRVFINLPIARHYPMIFLRGQNPSNLAANVDYTIGRGSITLLGHIEPPQVGTNIYIQYIK